MLGNGLYVDYGYRATDLKPTFIFASFRPAAALVNYGYGWDAGGKNINLITDATTNPATNLSMTYDHLDRLDTVTGWSQPMNFDYNEIGNMTKKVETDQPAKNYDIMYYGEGAPSRPHAITTADPASGANHVFNYDANGSMLSETNGGTVHSFQYDADGMVSYRNTPSEDTAHYYYDPDGVLVRKAPDTIAFGTGYLGHVYENNITQAEVTKYYFAAGARIAMRKGASLYYLAQDHLSGTAVITDAAQQMTGRVRYYPYGGTRTTEGTIPTDKLFTGQQRETANGIYHYNARLYNADVGRMPQPDLLIPQPSNSQSHNRYSYVINNPVNLTDPTGRDYRVGDCGSSWLYIFDQGGGLARFSFGVRSSRGPLLWVAYHVTWRNWSTAVSNGFGGVAVPSTIIPPRFTSFWAANFTVTTGAGLVIGTFSGSVMILSGYRPRGCTILNPSDSEYVSS